jgi:hypothetical protein
VSGSGFRATGKVLAQRLRKRKRSAKHGLAGEILPGQFFAPRLAKTAILFPAFAT